MFLSASRRTDIPNYYSEWFFNRVRAGYVLVRNPRNAHQIHRIALNPDVVDGIVFWTKNPIPMVDKLQRLHDYMYYFQFTLNAYGKDVERGIPSKNNRIIPAFQKLSDCIGPDRVIWRYDPIFLNETYTVAYHLRYFEALAKRLSPYTRRCTISFLDFYRNIARNLASLSIQKLTREQQELLAKHLSEIAHGYGLEIDTCAEELDLQRYGISHARCVDDRLFGKLLHGRLKVGKDKNQRLSCGCVESLDLGAYRTCKSGCRYCYAQFGTAPMGRHDPQSPLLIGEIGPEDRIIERDMRSCRAAQLEFDL